MSQFNIIRINQIRLELNDNTEKLIYKASKLLGISPDKISKYEILRRSIDARDKEDIFYSYSIYVYIDKNIKINKKVYNKDIMLTNVDEYDFDPSIFENRQKLSDKPIVVGMGPAGLFCGYFLALYGYKPILIERGEDVDSRIKTVDKFWDTGKLEVESNVQFGEGGAGTFSDGKLNTSVKDKFGRNHKVLDIFTKFGANEDIKYDSKPHIGTDILCGIVKNIREEIIRLGGTVLFNTKLVDININSNNEVEAITVSNTKDNTSYNINTKVLVLALGHSARDTFYKLNLLGIKMVPKSFAVGVRVEHPRNMIDTSMYGDKYSDVLSSAPYKLTYTASNGRGVYSFCMCPGGYVVNASSEEERTCVNGMSYSKRDGANSNSAIVVSVNPEDFGTQGALAGLEFQRKLEENAYKEGKGAIPVQLFSDFINNVASTELGEVTPEIKGKWNFANLRNVFPDFINESLIEGMNKFDRNIKGFGRGDAIFSGVESRTSSPLRIVRDDFFEANIKGIYPCGEGAGYAGGITSAAMDGIRVFEKISEKYC